MSKRETARHYKCSDIVSELETYIVGNQIATGVELPGTTELANRYRVSEKTIHRAMQTLADKKLIQRVRGAGSFVRNNMTLARRSRIGFFFFETQAIEIPALDNILSHHSRQMLKQILEDAGHSVEFYYDRVPTVENCPLLKMELSRFDYIIAEAGYRLVAADALRNFPGEVILFGDDIFSFGPWHQVFFDYRPGFLKALEYLKGRGFREAMVVGVPTLTTSLRRYEALCEMADQCGFRRENLHFPEPEEHYFHFPVLCGREYGKIFLKEYKSNVAIISLSDYLTAGVLDVLHEKGLKHGRDVQLISYDNFLGQVPEFQERFKCDSITHPLNAEFKAIIKMISEVYLAPDAGFFRSITIPAQEFTVNVHSE